MTVAPVALDFGAARLRALWPMFVAVLAVALLLPVLHWQHSDYATEQAPALMALAAGHLRGLAQLPPYGVSLLLRLPAVLPVIWLGGDRATIETALSFAALLIAAPLMWIAYARITASFTTLTIAVLLAIVGPVSVLAVASGHADMLDASALLLTAIVRVDLREGDVTRLDSVLLALAVAIRPDLVAVLPCLWARPSARRLAASASAVLLAGLVFAVIVGESAPALLLGGSHGLVRWPSVWALLAIPVWPSVRLLVLAVCLLAAWSTRRRSLLLSVVVVVLARCVMDPWITWYYALPAIVALAAVEIRGARQPWLACLLPLIPVLVVVFVS